jgi:hypothetical protein
MNQAMMEPANGAAGSRVWRWGIGLASVVILYIVAVIAFIIVY